MWDYHDLCKFKIILELTLELEAIAVIFMTEFDVAQSWRRKVLIVHNVQLIVT